MQDGVIYTAPAAVIGTVTSVTGPFWNQANGQKWDGADGPLPDAVIDYTVPMRYREVTLQVVEVLWDDIDLSSEKLTMLVSGGGDTQVGDEPFKAGQFTEGEEVLVLLSSDVFFMREGPVEAVRPYYSRQGVYHLVADISEVRVVPDVVHVARAAEPEVPDITLPPVAAFPVLEDFVAEAHALRSGSHPEWEPYRPAKGQAAAMIALINAEVAEARDRLSQP